MAADGSAIILPDGLVNEEPRPSRIQVFLRKARGHVEKPTNRNLVQSQSVVISADGKFAESDAGSTSGYSESHRFAGQGGGGAFAEGALTKNYKPIPGYEGLHRWDPNAQWTPEEEKRLVRKLDYKVCAFVCLMFFALQIDRGNIGQVLSDGFLGDLNLDRNQYNYGQIIFYISFLCAELPSQLISKKLGPDNWIPIQMICWSIVAICQCRLSGEKSFYACRALLGLIEGGFIPDVILYLSYFYTSVELPIRLSFFWCSYMFTNIISAFLAFGILHMRGVGGWAGWRWLFALEGIFTIIIGIVAFFYLPPSPTQTASRFRGKDGWFTAHEEVIMVNRVLRDDPSKGDMHNREGLSFPLIWSALLDYDMWPLYLLGLTAYIPNQPIGAYMTLTLIDLGFGTFNTNLLTIPASALLIVQLLFWTWLSEKINNRFVIVMVTQLWVLPLLIALDLLPSDASKWARYAITTLLVGYPYCHAILVGLTSRNAGSVRTRTVASALFNMFVQAGSVVASNIYQADDQPYYHKGNKALLGVCAFNMVLIIFLKVYYILRNKNKAAKWDAMTEPEKNEYLKTTKDEGNKRLDFRFAH